jgi:hypothetical protein
MTLPIDTAPAKAASISNYTLIWTQILCDIDVLVRQGICTREKK